MDRSIGITKLLKAPIDTVWAAWTVPEQIAQWWGPAGFTNIIHNMELQANGEWRLTMLGPDGKRYPNKSVFIEVEPPEKIIFKHFNPDYLATVTFKQQGAGTLLDWHMVFETAELYATVVKVFKADQGLQQNVEKLEHFLAQKMKSNHE